jgi:hypothetical protein
MRSIAIDDYDGVLVGGDEVQGGVWVGRLERYTPSGDLDWSVNVDPPAGPYSSPMFDVCTDGDDRHYAVGRFMSSVNGDPTSRYVRAYDDEDELWTVESETAWLTAWAGCVASGDGIVAVGGRIAVEGGSTEAVVTALDPGGDELWTLELGPAPAYSASDIAREPTGDLLVIGNQDDQTMLARIGSDGTLLSMATFPGVGPMKVVADDSGSIHVLALEFYTQAPRIFSLDEDFDELWSAEPLAERVAPDYQAALGLALGPGGEIVVAGTLQPQGEALHGWWATYASDGEQLFDSPVDVDVPEGWLMDLYDVATTSDGGLVLVTQLWGQGTSSHVVRKQAL